MHSFFVSRERGSNNWRMEAASAIVGAGWSRLAAFHPYLAAPNLLQPCTTREFRVGATEEQRKKSLWREPHHDVNHRRNVERHIQAGSQAVGAQL